MLSIFFLTLQRNKTIMKKMLCYMLSSVFLLAILNSCGDDAKAIVEDVIGEPTLAELAGTFTADSDLDLNVKLTTGDIAVTSDKKTDGAAGEFKDETTDNLVITVTDAQLKVAGGTAVDVDGVFTFTIDELSYTDDLETEFEIDDTGSVDITVGAATSATTLALTSVAATEASTDGIKLTADATLTVASSYWAYCKLLLLQLTRANDTC